MNRPDAELLRALQAGDVEAVAARIAAGSDLRYRAEKGYDALVDAVHGRDLRRDKRLLELLELLVASGVPLDGETDYLESGLRVLSHHGRFDAVELLLRAGAPDTHLAFTPLHKAVAFGRRDEVERLCESGADLEAREWWSRTPFHLALVRGNVALAEVLSLHGADVHARARCGQTSLQLAIDAGRPDVVRWLLAEGHDVEERDEFGYTALRHAVDEDEIECARQLLAAGADPDGDARGSTGLYWAGSREMVTLLLDAGADSRELTAAGRRALVGLPMDEDESALNTISRADFDAGRSPRRGARNAEPMDDPFRLAMIRAGVSGYRATRHFDAPSSLRAGPVWCAHRFGQSLTHLPDGRIVLVAGEHEDSYDPDFYIYNDIFLFEPGGGVRIFGYPDDVFPPTDFHSATLRGTAIYLVGSLGYLEGRRYGETPVMRLDTETFHIEPVATTGTPPGWVYSHRAALVGDAIHVSDGLVLTSDGTKELRRPLEGVFALDLESFVWRRLAAAA